MICTALAVAFFVYPTVFALNMAMVRPQLVPAAPMRESKDVSCNLARTRHSQPKSRTPLFV